MADAGQVDMQEAPMLFSWNKKNMISDFNKTTTHIFSPNCVGFVSKAVMLAFFGIHRFCWRNKYICFDLMNNLYRQIVSWNIRGVIRISPENKANI